MLAIHRSYEGEVGSRNQVLYIGTDGTCERLSGAKAAKFLRGMAQGERALFTSAHSTDAVLLDLAARGVEIYYGHWHALGIDKGLDPEAIAVAFSSAPESELRKFVPRPDLAPLRGRVAARRAIVEARKAGILALSAIQRSLNTGKEKPEWLKAAVEKVNEDGNEIQTPLDAEIVKMAGEIPDCAAFARIAGLKGGMITAATVVAYCGDVVRFHSVSAERKCGATAALMTMVYVPRRI